MKTQEQGVSPEIARVPEHAADRVEARREVVPNGEKTVAEIDGLSALSDKLPADDPAHESVAKAITGARVKFPRLPKSLYGVVASIAVWGNTVDVTSSKPEKSPAQSSAIEAVMPTTAPAEAPSGPRLSAQEHEILLNDVVKAAKESQKILDRLRSFKERQRTQELERLAIEAKAHDEKMIEQYVAHHLGELANARFSAESIQALFDEVFQKGLPEALRQDNVRSSAIWNKLEDGMKKALDEKYDKDAAQGMYAASVLSPHEAFTRATDSKDPETLDMIMSEMFAGGGKFTKGDTTFQIERVLGDTGQRSVDFAYFDKVFEAMPEERRANWALMLKESVVDPALEAARDTAPPDPETTMSANEEERMDRQRAQDQGMSYEKFQELQKQQEEEHAEFLRTQEANIKRLETIVAKYLPPANTSDQGQ